MIYPEDFFNKIIKKFSDHPSIAKIKNIEYSQKFKCYHVEPLGVTRTVISLDIKEKINSNIPAFILKDHINKIFHT